MSRVATLARYLGAPINHDAAIAAATGAHLFVSDARSADGPPGERCRLIAADSHTTSNMLFFFSLLMETRFLY